LDTSQLFALPLWYVVFLLSLTCHEAAHAWVAQRGGDFTAAMAGQVSLDPIPHIRREPFGMVLVPIFTFLLNGWMLGWASAPYNVMWARRYPKRAARMALAGPVANFALMLIAVIGIKLGIVFGLFAAPDSLSFDHIVVMADQSVNPITFVLSITFSLNLLLGTFNLLPVPPLDGNGIVPLFLDDHQGRRWQEIFANPSMALMGLVIAWVVFGRLFGLIFDLGIFLLYPGISYG